MEIRPCIAAEEFIEHIPHNYTPQDMQEKYICEGIFLVYPNEEPIEQQSFINYAIAMYVTIDGVRMLHKSNTRFKTIVEAETGLKLFKEDFKPGLWFIVKDITEISSYLVDN